jgi:IS1 family transposase
LLPCRRIQVDEAWAFCYAKQKNVATAKAAPAGAGDIWTWVGLDADTKLVASWYVGARDSEAAMEFMDDLAPRLAHRVQLTSDGHKPCLEAVEGAFGGDIDYAMLIKHYGPLPEQTAARRHSPAECTGVSIKAVEGRPTPKYISTSYVERQNLNIRTGNRRMTRLTYAFSKKAANHNHMMAHLLHALRFRAHSEDAEDDARHGRWRHTQALGDGRYGEGAGRLGSRSGLSGARPVVRMAGASGASRMAEAESERDAA